VVCSNALLVRQETLDQVLLAAIAEVLDARLLEEAMQRAVQRLRAGQERHLDRRTQIERELSLIEATEARLVDGIARGDAMDPLLARLKAEEARKKALKGELAGLVTRRPAAALDERRALGELRRRVRDVKALLARNVPGTRDLLKTLLVGRLVAEPVT